MARSRTPKRATPRKKPKRPQPSKRSLAARRGWVNRRKRERAMQRAREWATRERDFDDEIADHDTDDTPDQPTYPWDQEGWEPPGGWQGDDLAYEISYMTHEEKIDFFEWLSEELDIPVHDLFEMSYGRYAE